MKRRRICLGFLFTLSLFHFGSQISFEINLPYGLTITTGIILLFSLYMLKVVLNADLYQMMHVRDSFQYTHGHEEVLRCTLCILLLQHTLSLMLHEVFRHVPAHHQGQDKNNLHCPSF